MAVMISVAIARAKPDQSRTFEPLAKKKPGGLSPRIKAF